MPTTRSNFIVNGAAALVGAAVVAAGSVQAESNEAAIQQVNDGGAFHVDYHTVDLSRAGYAANGAFYLSLTANTPVTVDLTNIAAQTYSAGDSLASALKELVIYNNGAAAVIYSAGASNGFVGFLGGTSPTVTIPAGGRFRITNSTGWTIDSTHKTVKFDPGSSAASIAVAFGGV